MTDLTDAMPRDAILQIVPDVQFQSYGQSQIKEIVKMKPKTMYEMGLVAWHAAMTSGQFGLDPMTLAKHVDNEEPNLLKYVAQALGRKVIFDIDYTMGSVESVPLEDPAIQALVAHLFPNRIHIGDVRLLNPLRPRDGVSSDDDQSHESLQLFERFMENCRLVAQELGADKITLTAAFGSLVDPFRRHGFEVESSGMAQMALEAGCGIPMELSL